MKRLNLELGVLFLAFPKYLPSCAFHTQTIQKTEQEQHESKTNSDDKPSDAKPLKGLCTKQTEHSQANFTA